MKLTFLIVSCLIITSTSLKSQIIKPNIGVKSHPTLTVERIETILKNTVISLSIKCEVEQGGWFCADKNIVLRDPISNREYKILKSENIPVCPQQHHFKKKGETLIFKLYFPELPASTKYIDLIEMCNDACFYVKGIVLSTGFNAEIEMAYLFYAQKKYTESAQAFEQLTVAHADYPYGIYHFQAIKTYSELKNKPKAAACLTRFKQTNVLDRQFYDELIAKNRYGD